MIHVLLTEEKTSGRHYLKNLLEKQSIVNIIGMPENSIEILYALIQNHVDLMIVDKNMKSINDTDCAGMISKLSIDVKILLLLDNEQEFTNLKNPELFAGYILKSHSPEKIMTTITSVLDRKPKSYIPQGANIARQALYS